MYLIDHSNNGEKRITLPSSKSLSHRALILSALNRGRCEIANLLGAEDTIITRKALEILGAEFREEENRLVSASPIGRTAGDDIFLGNSGSSARFLLPLAFFADKPVRFSGVNRLHERPFSELFALLKQLGGRIEASGNSLPATVYPSKLAGGVIEPGKLPSSQVVSSLMMAAILMENDLIIRLPEDIPSLPYILMTYKLMKKLGLQVDFRNNEIFIKKGVPEMDWFYTVEKDMSSASYWVVYALINGASVVLPDIALPSVQGDERILSIAEEAGGSVTLENGGVVVSGKISKAIDVDCFGIPDLVPALAVLAIFGPAESKLRNVKHLEYKESNRIEAILNNVSALGGAGRYDGKDLFIIPTQKYNGAVIETYNDHRIAMSFAIAGTRIKDVVISNPACVNKSYPEFWGALNFKEVKESYERQA